MVQCVSSSSSSTSSSSVVSLDVGDSIVGVLFVVVGSASVSSHRETDDCSVFELLLVPYEDARRLPAPPTSSKFVCQLVDGLEEEEDLVERRCDTDANAAADEEEDDDDTKEERDAAAAVVGV